jgi:hypothetical protein
VVEATGGRRPAPLPGLLSELPVVTATAGGRRPTPLPGLLSEPLVPATMIKSLDRLAVAAVAFEVDVVGVLVCDVLEPVRLNG